MAVTSGKTKMPRNPNCELCELHHSSKNVCIMGHGDGEAFIVGEAPGKEEGRTGKPFMGQSGKLLRGMLADVGIDDAYITNAAKCRPPNNRKPEPSELAACKPYLLEEIEERKPKVILLLGAVAMKSCIGKTGITEMNGQLVTKNGQDYLCAFHPAYILRDPSKTDSLHMALSRYAASLKGELSTEMPPWQPIDHSTFDEFINDWVRADTFAFDVETAGEKEGDGLRWWTPEFDITSIAFSLSGLNFIEKNWGLALAGHPKHVLSRDLCQELLQWLVDHQGDKRGIAWNGKFDNNCLQAAYGLRFRLDSDAMLAHHVIDENTTHQLKSNARSELGAPDYDLSTKEKRNTSLVPIRRLLAYNAGDSAYTRRLDSMFMKRMDESEQWYYNRVHMPIARAYEEIERNGLYVDLTRLNQMEEDVRGKLELSLVKLNKIAGREINWNSPVQIASLLFGDLGLTPTVLTDKGNPSTGEEALIDIDHPITKALEEYRNHEKFLSTYIGRKQEDGTYAGGWREFMEGPHLYLSTKLHGTVTGRFSSRLHQVPRDGVVRECITAPPGWKHGVLDLNQAELRTIAIVAREPEMLRCFRENEDIHLKTLMAAVQSGGGEYVELVLQTGEKIAKKKLDFNDSIEAIWNYAKYDPELIVKLDKAWKEARKKAKGINFGFVFDQSPPGFINYAKMKYGFEPTLPEATQFHSTFFDLYQALVAWHERQRKLVRQDGFVRDLLGMKRRLPGIYSSDRKLVSEAERQSINAPIQGFIGRYKAMILLEMHQSFPRNMLRVNGEVHDSVLFWYKDDSILPELYERAENPALAKEAGLNFPIPMSISLELGRWGAGRTYKP